MPDQVEPTALFGRYTKVVTAIFGASVLTVLNYTAGPGDWWVPLAAYGTALGVYSFPNLPQRPNV